MRKNIDKLKTSSSITTLALFLFFVLMQLTTWIPLRYWHIWGGGNFIDSQLILNWSKCYETMGNYVFKSYGDCSGYVYGSTLLKVLSFFKVSVSTTQAFGFLLMFILALSISYKMNTLVKYREDPLIILIVLSPPVLLLAERGNFDVLMFGLISFAGLLFARNYQVWALIPLCLATLIKFYSLPLFVIFYFLNSDKGRKLATFLAGIAVTIQVVFDLRIIQSTFPSGYSWKFGASIWTRYLSQLNIPDLGERMNNLSGVIILFLIAGLTLKVLKRIKLVDVLEISSQQNERILFYLFLSTHVSCFISGMSYDYRLIFLAMASIIYLKSFCVRYDLAWKIVLVFTLISLWLTFPSSGLEPVGDLATEVLTVFLASRMVQMFKLELKLRNAE